MDNNRKYIIIGGLLFILIVVLLVFVFTRGSNKKETRATTLTIWDSFDSEESFSDIFQTYQAENKNIEIKFVKKDPAKFEQDSINAFASGGGPDIWVIPNTWLPKHHDKLAALPEKTLDPKKKKSNEEVYKNTFVSVATEDNVIDGQVYGMPIFMDSLSLFYRSELLNNKLSLYIKTHPETDVTEIRRILTTAPATWDDLVKIIQYSGQDAIALGSAEGIDRASEILQALMLQYGAKMTTDDKTSAIFQTSTNQFSETAYPGAKALSFYTSFAKMGETNYTWPAKENAYQAFIEGKLAMMIDLSQRQEDIKKDIHQSAEVTYLPQIKDTENPRDLALYQTWTVSKTSRFSVEAWNLIKYLAAPTIQTKYLAKTGLASSLKEKTQNSTNFIDVQNNYAVSWYNPNPEKVDEIFKNAISQVLGGNNPQTVLEGAAARVTTLLGELKK